MVYGQIQQSQEILVAEDDRATRDSLTLALTLEGYHVIPALNGQQALERIEIQIPSLVVLDLMMPYLDGLSVCREIRSKKIETPILMLTARTEIGDRVSGLDMGADDYLVKPYALEELLARVRALLRRSKPESCEPLAVGPLVVDELQRRAFIGAKEIDLTKTEFDLLSLLAKNAGKVLTQSNIYEEIWGYDFGLDSKNLAVYIGYLRRKLECDGGDRIIHTVRGVGYSMRIG